MIMTDRSFVLVSLETKSSARASEFEASLNKAIDWIQIKENTWLVWTTSDAQRWYRRLKPKLKDGERVFICGIQPDNRSGWMPKAFWEFVRSKVPSKTH